MKLLSQVKRDLTRCLTAQVSAACLFIFCLIQRGNYKIQSQGHSFIEQCNIITCFYTESLVLQTCHILQACLHICYFNCLVTRVTLHTPSQI